MNRSRGLASDAVTRAVLPIHETHGQGNAAPDPEYVRCDHGYLRRGWCDECHAVAMGWLGRADPRLAARLADGP